MSSAYWDQWDHSEIMSMHGVELDECYDCDEDHDVDYESNEDDDVDCCPRCTGGGCNYCLMLSW